MELNSLIRVLLTFGGSLLAFEFVSPPELPCNQLYLYATIITVIIYTIDRFVPSMRIDGCRLGPEGARS